MHCDHPTTEPAAAPRGFSPPISANCRRNSTLADTLLERIDDPDPVVAMQAIKGLWRWWYWRSDLSLRNRIEDRLIAALAEPRHPWVRRNLIEALYIIGDDNIRYLYQNWVPSLAQAENRRRATAGQHATVNRLGAKYVTALGAGNRLQREGVLRAMSEFFERPVLGGRIGNDLEPMLFYDDMVAEGRGRPDHADGRPRPGHPPSGASGSGHDPRRPLAGPGPRSRAAAGRCRRLGPRLGDHHEQGVSLERQPGQGRSRNARAGRGTVGPGHSRGPGRRAGARRPASDRSPASSRTAIPRRRSGRGWTRRARPFAPRPMAALLSFPALWSERSVHDAIERGLADSDPQARAAAVRLALEPKAKIADSALRKALDDPAPRLASLCSSGSPPRRGSESTCAASAS